MKAIETRYKGYRFRSRLEARWAVFFDAINLTWEYEPEGVVVGDGQRYLPDFHLPDFGGTIDLWVEIKPKAPIPADGRVMAFIDALGAQDGDSGLLMCAGEPEGVEALLAAHSREGKTFSFIESTKEGRAAFLSFFASHSGVTEARVAYAMLKARGARFEFGEKG
jgi:hypothetical protein